MKKKFIGIDIGGTKISGIVLDENATVLSEFRTPTGDTQSCEVLLAEVLNVINTLRTDYEIEAIGFGIAGFINNKEGTVRSSPNIKCFNNYCIAKIIEEKTHMKTFVDNDVKSAAIYELSLGEGKEIDDFILITLGTGIGSAIVINRHIVRGKDNLAGEIGHLTLDENGRLCGCGKIGCFETISSGPAIRQSVLELISKGRKTSLIELSNNNVASIDVPLISKAASLGDKLSLEVLANAAHYIGLVLSYLTNTLNPEKIILAGGLLKGLTPVREVLLNAFDRFTLTIPKQTVKIVDSSMPENAVSIGAALAALKAIGGEKI